jgi:type I restriction enzyme R subunit
MPNSCNFEFLAEYDPVFLQLTTAAERVFSSDPNTTLIKLRQLGEALAQDLATRTGIVFDENTTQSDLLWKLNREIDLDSTIRNLFHTLRIEGNKATHQFQTQHKEAMNGLRIAQALAVWFHQSFGKQGANFKPGPFVAPQDPSRQLRELQSEIEKLKVNLRDANQQLDSSQELADLVAKEKEEYAVLAHQMDVEARTYEQLAGEAEEALQKQKAEFEQRLKEMQAQSGGQVQVAPSVVENTQKASSQFTLNEELARILIDQQLINAGWNADTQELTYKKGARPEKGKN